MLEKASYWLRKKVDRMLNYAVVLVTDSYDPKSDFLYTFKENLRVSIDNVDSRLGYVLVAIDATPRQLGMYDENTLTSFFDGTDLDEYVRVFMSMTESQAEAIMGIKLSIDLESFSLIFAGLMSTDITAKPNPDATISVPMFNHNNDIVDVLIVKLDKICVSDAAINSWEKLTNCAVELVESGDGERYSDAVRREVESHAEPANRDNDENDNENDRTTGVNLGPKSRKSFSTKNTPDEDDGPYSDEALRRMFEQVEDDEEVGDSAVDFIIAMMNKMTEDQKINVIDQISKNWMSIVGPKATSMLMSLTEVASDIPTAVKTYKDSLDKTFPDGVLSEEAKAQMLVHFHAGLVQKVI